MPTETVHRNLRRIRALLRMARKTSELAEAEAYLARAKELMAKYGLSERDVRESAMESQTAVAIVEKRVSWETRAACHVVSQHFNVEAFHSHRLDPARPRRSVLIETTLFGRPENLQVGCHVFAFIRDRMRKEWKCKSRVWALPRRDRSGFMVAMATGISDRLQIASAHRVDMGAAVAGTDIVQGPGPTERDLKDAMPNINPPRKVKRPSCSRGTFIIAHSSGLRTEILTALEKESRPP